MIDREEASRGRSTSGRTSRTATSARSPRTRAALEKVELPARVPRRGAGRVRGATGGTARLLGLRRPSPSIGDLLAPRGVVRELCAWPLLSFFTLPMALVGGVLAAYFFGSGIISLGSLVGFFTILGIVARNGIMQISHFQHLEEHEGETFGPELVLRGAEERVAPILMTALTTGLALVPLADRRATSPARRSSTRWRSSSSAGSSRRRCSTCSSCPSLYLRFGRGWAAPPRLRRRWRQPDDPGEEPAWSGVRHHPIDGGAVLRARGGGVRGREREPRTANPLGRRHRGGPLVSAKDFGSGDLHRLR